MNRSGNEQQKKMAFEPSNIDDMMLDEGKYDQLSLEEKEGMNERAVMPLPHLRMVDVDPFSGTEITRPSLYGPKLGALVMASRVCKKETFTDQKGEAVKKDSVLGHLVGWNEERESFVVRVTHSGTDKSEVAMLPEELQEVSAGEHGIDRPEPAFPELPKRLRKNALKDPWFDPPKLSWQSDPPLLPLAKGKATNTPAPASTSHKAPPPGACMCAPPSKSTSPTPVPKTKAAPASSAASSISGGAPPLQRERSPVKAPPPHIAKGSSSYQGESVPSNPYKNENMGRAGTGESPDRRPAVMVGPRQAPPPKLPPFASLDEALRPSVRPQEDRAEEKAQQDVEQDYRAWADDLMAFQEKVIPMPVSYTHLTLPTKA